MNESIAGSSGSVPDLDSKPGLAYRQALRLYDVGRLRAMVQSLGGTDRNARAGTLAAEVVERLEIAAVRQAQVEALGPAERIAMGVLGITEAPIWRVSGLSRTLRLLGIDPAPTIAAMVASGLLAERSGLIVGSSGGPPSAGEEEVVAHPAVLESARTALPEWGDLPTVENVRLIRESDALEPILRLAALWQRVADSPLRQTQSGALYKRDRDRIDDDPALAGPIADMIEPLPDMPGLWLDLSRGVGLVESEPGSDRLVASSAEFWDENAVHLPQMIASRWLRLRGWDELWGRQEDPNGPPLAAPYVRAAALLWLAAMPENHWVRLADLASLFDGLLPHWESPLVVDVAASTPAATAEGDAAAGEAKAATRSKKKSAGRRKAAGQELLSALLGGMAYQLGLVRIAEEDPSGDRVVQLSPRGRYVLRLGPSPGAGAAFDGFLYVQPNLEIIAYRQGLTPNRIGQLSRFARWSRLGAALELRLTAEDTYRGLEAGLTAESMLERLSRHSARPLGANVGEAIRTWATRRERLTYYMAATLVEFTSAADLQSALASWDELGAPRPLVLTDRLVLVENDAAIPLQRLRMLGSRDYRRPPEVCVGVEDDGVTLVLDPSRGDLFADAELSRFAEEQNEAAPMTPSRGPAALGRRYRVTRESLARAKGDRASLASLNTWFERRTGAPIPPAIRLLLEGLEAPSERPVLERLYLLRVRSSEILDGLAQHPATRELLLERLGPCCVSVRPGDLDTLRQRLGELGLEVDSGLEPA